jgi:hypothetical protein
MIFKQSLQDFPLTVALGTGTPSFGLQRNRQSLRFVPPDDEGFTVRGDRRRLWYKGRRRSHRFTILGDTAFEYDCILHKETDTNVITLLIDGAEHFDFYRQPDFVRDPFLKGSYAVYQKTTLMGEGTGKLCHIHRPLIIDALGRRCWGDLAVAGNVLRITIPEWWLAGAKYPVVVDPTVGTSTVGSQFKDIEGEILLFDCQMPVNRFLISEVINGTCTAVFYTDRDDTEVGGRPVLYSDNGNKPQTRKSMNEGLVDLRVTSNKPKGWRETTFKSNGSIASGSYVWFGLFGEYMWYPRFDYGTKCYIDFWDDVEIIPQTYPINNVNVYDNYRLSMYFTYTPPQSFSRTLTQGVALTASPHVKTEYVKQFNHTVDGSAVVGGAVSFFRQCWSYITHSGAVVRSAGFIRALWQPLDVFSGLVKGSALLSTIIDTVQAGVFLERVQGLWRIIGDTAAAGDTVFFPVLMVRTMRETKKTSDIFSLWGDYIRGLVDYADNTAETQHSGEYSKIIEDTVWNWGITTKGLMLIVRLFSKVVIHDYFVRRFLVAREELKIKSCICRDMVLDSRID